MTLLRFHKDQLFVFLQAKQGKRWDLGLVWIGRPGKFGIGFSFALG
jgi:hypothetical protein